LRAFTAGCGALCLALGIVVAAAADSNLSPRERAVADARAGRVDVAIAELRGMLAQGTPDPLVAMDLAVLLYQANQAKAATDVFEQAGNAAPPGYALLAMSRAYRDQHRFDAAERLARTGSARFPDDPTWPVLLALIRADRGESDDALRLLATPAAARAPPLDRKLAEAYALRRGARSMAALKAYMEALRLAPENAEARREAAELLREIGGPNGAAAWVDAAPPLATGGERLSLAADQAAAMVRWGAEIRSSDPAHRFDGTDAAIAQLDRLIAEASAAPDTEPEVLTRLQLDRIVALRDRVRMAEAAQEAEALRAAGVTLPPYAARAYADALLYLHRPREARAAYEAALKDDPADLDARYGLFYAEVEAEDFAAAYRTIDGILADSPPWKQYRDDPSRHSNPDYASAALAAGMARLYGDQLGAAQERIAPIAAAAPADAEARADNAAVMDARGWPRQAEREAKIAASLEPADPDAELALAGLDIERYRFSAAERRLARLQALYPENTQVRRMAEELAAAEGAELDVEVSPGWTEGGGANASGNELTLGTRLWSPPIDDRWRVFAFDDYSYAHPPEGFVERHHAGAGAELRLPDVTATAYGTYSTGELQRPGGGFTLDWSPDDHWQFGVAGEIFSLDTPLRALFDDTTADKIGGHVTYRWHESRELTLSGAYLGFSDGNRQGNAGLDFAQRLVDIPHFDLTGRLGLSASSNSKQDVGYYSPEADLTATGGLTAEHVLWRSYDNSLVQALTVDAGVYDERSFGADWIGSVGYEQRWRFDPWTEIRYGALLTRRVFDGDAEEGIALTLGLTQRF